jgi:hypothetical protein
MEIQIENQTASVNLISFKSIKHKRELTNKGLCMTCEINPIHVNRRCISCSKEYYKQKRLRKIAGIVAKNPNKLRYKYMEIYKDARRRGKEFNLDFESVSAMITGNCHYCGIDGQLGLDRIDSDKGYIEGNVVSCCKTCNFAKRTMTEQEFYSWIDRIALHQGYKKSI